MTIILVTHEYDVALYAKRILHFRDGLIIKDEINEKRRSVSPVQSAHGREVA